MELDKNGNMTVYIVGHGDTKYEISKPEWLSYQGWKEFVDLFHDEKIYYDDVKMLLAVLRMNIKNGKDTGKDLIDALQLSIVSKIFEIHMIQDLVNASKYKSGEVRDLIINI